MLFSAKTTAAPSVLRQTANQKAVAGKIERAASSSFE